MADRCDKSKVCGLKDRFDTVDDLQKAMQDMIRESICTREEVSGYLMSVGAWPTSSRSDYSAIPTVKPMVTEHVFESAITKIVPPKQELKPLPVEIDRRIGFRDIRDTILKDLDDTTIKQLHEITRIYDQEVERESD